MGVEGETLVRNKAYTGFGIWGPDQGVERSSGKQFIQNQGVQGCMVQGYTGLGCWGSVAK